MREINLDTEVAVLNNTFLCYGDTRSGKTKFAASFPRPVFFADATEKGWDTIANMNSEEFFEADVRPLVWGIEAMNDMAMAREKVKPLIASGRVRTIVIDSLSFYGDLYLNSLLNLQNKYDARSAYGSLGIHLRDLRVQIHGFNVNVVWLCLAKHPEVETDKDGTVISSSPGSPLIPGQQADKFSAGVQSLFYFRKDSRGSAQQKVAPVYEIHTQPFNKYVAGNRLGDRAHMLPEPLIGNYSTYLEAIGYNPDEIRAQLPKLTQAKPVAPPLKITQKPPITITRPTNGQPKVG